MQFITNGNVNVIKNDIYGNIYIGGTFTTVGENNLLVNHIAKFNIISNNWEALGLGIAGDYASGAYVNALEFDSQNNLYIGGLFTQGINTGGGNVSSPNIIIYNTNINAYELVDAGQNVISEVFTLAFSSYHNRIYIGFKQATLSTTIVLTYYDIVNSVIVSQIYNSNWTAYQNTILKLAIDNTRNILYISIDINDRLAYLEVSYGYDINAIKFLPTYAAQRSETYTSLLLDASGGLYAARTTQPYAQNWYSQIDYWFEYELLRTYSPVASATSAGNGTQINSLILDANNNLYIGGYFSRTYMTGSSNCLETLNICVLSISNNQFRFLDSTISTTNFIPGFGGLSDAINGMNGIVNSLAIVNNNLFIGGNFSRYMTGTYIIPTNIQIPAHSLGIFDINKNSMSNTLVSNTPISKNIDLKITDISHNLIVLSSVSSGPVSYVIDTVPTAGQLKDASNNNIQTGTDYTNSSIYYDASGVGTVSFTYHVRNSVSRSAESTVTIDISANIIITPPVSYDISFNIYDNEIIPVYLIGNASYGNSIKYHINSDASHGTLVDSSFNSIIGSTDLSTNLVYYTANANYKGTDSFTYSVRDLSFSLYSPVSHVSFNVSNAIVNFTPPTSTSFSKSMLQDASNVSIQLIGSSSYIYPLIYKINTVPSSGQLKDASMNNINTGTDLSSNILYYDASSIADTYSFNYQVYDSETGLYSTESTVSLNVRIKPVLEASDININLYENSSATIILDASDNITEDANAITYYIKINPLNGSLYYITDTNKILLPNTSNIIIPNNINQLIYEPNFEFTGTDQVIYYAIDTSNNTISNNATINILVKPINNLYFANQDFITNGTVYTMVNDTSGNIYVGGSFSIVGTDISANNIAVYNTNTSTWNNLNNGVKSSINTGSVLSLALKYNKLYVGGNFNTVGLNTTANSIATYFNGVWSPLDASNICNGYITSIEFDNSDNLFIGGSYSRIGSLNTNNISAYNIRTQTWSKLGSGGVGGVGSTVNYYINSIKLDSNKENLYVGGNLDIAHNTTNLTCNGIAKYNLNTGIWNSVGHGLENFNGANNPNIKSICVDNSNNLYIGGYFTGIINSDNTIINSNMIAKWNGNIWSQLGGTGFNEPVYSLTMDLTNSNNNLYIGGTFYTANGQNISHRIVKYNNNTNSWDSIAYGLRYTTFDSGVCALLFYNKLYIGGSFTSAGSGPELGYLNPQTPGYLLNNLAIYTPNTNTIGRKIYDTIHNAPNNSLLLKSYLDITVSKVSYKSNNPTFTNEFKKYIRHYYNKFALQETDTSNNLYADISGNVIFGLLTNLSQNYLLSQATLTFALFPSSQFVNVNLYKRNSYYLPLLDLDYILPQVQGFDYNVLQYSNNKIIYNNINYDINQYIDLDSSQNHFLIPRGFGSVLIESSNAHEFKANDTVYSIANNNNNNNIYIGGKFTQVGGIISASGMAKYNKYAQWEPIGVNILDQTSVIVNSVVTDTSNNIYFGGNLREFNNTAAGNIILKYKEDSTPNYEYLGAPMSPNSIVNNLIYNSNNSNLYIGGTFQNIGGLTNVGYIAQLNQNNNTYNWSKLSNGLDASANSTNCFEIDLSNNLYVGGKFKNISGNINMMNSIAKWNGASWVNLSHGLIDSTNVDNIATVKSIYYNRNNHLLYAAGNFDGIGNNPSFSVKNIAVWNGSAWSALSNAEPRDPPNSITMDTQDISNNILYSGTDGSHNKIRDLSNNIVLNYNIVCKYDINTNTWSNTDNGLYASNNGMSDMRIINNKLFMAGAFTADGSNIKQLEHLAIYRSNNNIINNSVFSIPDGSDNLITISSSSFTEINLFGSEIDNLDIIYVITQLPQYGQLKNSNFETIDSAPFILYNSQIYYLPTNNPNNTDDTFKYYVSNSYSESTESTITLKISPVPCMTEDTDINTSSGYKNIKELKTGDYILTDDGRNVKIVNILKNIMRGNKKTFPYIISKGSIDPYKNYPKEDIKLSGSHLIKYNNTWICPKYCNIFKQDESKKLIIYYHIELENYITDNLVVNNGTIIESMSSLGINKSRDKQERNRRLGFCDEYIKTSKNNSTLPKVMHIKKSAIAAKNKKIIIKLL